MLHGILRSRLVSASAFAIGVSVAVLSASEPDTSSSRTSSPRRNSFVWCYLSDLADNGYLNMTGSDHSELRAAGAFHFLPWEPYTDPDCTWARAELWIDGVEDEIKSCLDGLMSGGACIEASQSNGFGASATVSQKAQSGVPRFFNIWSAYMNQMIIDRYDSTWMQPSRQTNVNLGYSPQEECAEQNNRWNEWTETCEINPDGANGSPIIIPIGKKEKYRLTSVSSGVRFDLDNDGLAELVAWTEADSEFAFLAVDRNGDGKITSGSELFGDRTVPNATNGFLALERLAAQDPDGNPAAIEEGDQIYPHLLLWTDRNHNGQSEASELQYAREVLTRIGVGYMREPGNVDKYDNRFLYSGWAERRTAPGKNKPKSGKDHRDRLLKIYDVFLSMINVA